MWMCVRMQGNIQDLIKWLIWTTVFSKTFVNRWLQVFSSRIKKGDAKVTDIQCLKYTSDGKISFKINYSEYFKLLPRYDETSRPNVTNNSTRKTRRKSKDKQHPSTSNSADKTDLNEFREAQFPNLYQSPFKITEAKFKHLQELKITLPRA